MAEPSIWLIKRNCSASPRQLAGVLVSVVVISFAFGVAFATQGLWMVLPFVGLEVLAVAAAFIFYGRQHFLQPLKPFAEITAMVPRPP